MTDITARDLTVTAADGYSLSARLLTPPQPTLAILVSSGTGFPKGFYERFARHMAGRGAMVLTCDYRGIGDSRPNDLASMQMDYVDWGRLDMAAALDALIAQAGDLPVTHVGHSAGGHFAGFMRNHALIARHAFVSVGTGWWGGHHRSYNPVELFFWFGLGPWHLLRHGFIKSGGLWRGADLPRGVFQTWRRWALKPPYFADELEHRLQPHWFGQVTAPIVSWIFTDDPIATPANARELLGLYTRAPWTVRVSAARDHGVKRIGHEGAFRRGMEPLWDEMFDWLADGETSDAAYMRASPTP